MERPTGRGLLLLQSCIDVKGEFSLIWMIFSAIIAESAYVRRESDASLIDTACRSVYNIRRTYGEESPDVFTRTM